MRHHLRETFLFGFTSVQIPEYRLDSSWVILCSGEEGGDISRSDIYRETWIFQANSRAVGKTQLASSNEKTTEIALEKYSSKTMCVCVCICEGTDVRKC